MRVLTRPPLRENVGPNPRNKTAATAPRVLLVGPSLTKCLRTGWRRRGANRRTFASARRLQRRGRRGAQRSRSRSTSSRSSPPPSSPARVGEECGAYRRPRGDGASSRPRARGPRASRRSPLSASWSRWLLRFGPTIISSGRTGTLPRPPLTCDVGPNPPNKTATAAPRVLLVGPELRKRLQVGRIRGGAKRRTGATARRHQR